MKLNKLPTKQFVLIKIIKLTKYQLGHKLTKDKILDTKHHHKARLAISMIKVKVKDLISKMKINNHFTAGTTLIRIKIGIDNDSFIFSFIIF